MIFQPTAFGLTNVPGADPTLQYYLQSQFAAAAAARYSETRAARQGVRGWAGGREKLMEICAIIHRNYIYFLIFAKVTPGFLLHMGYVRANSHQTTSCFEHSPESSCRV